MPAQLEVILVDTGESAEQVVDRANTAPRPGGRRVDPSESPGGGGGEKASKPGATVTDGLIGLAKVLGVGGAITKVIDLTKAFSDLYRAVNDTTKSHRDAETTGKRKKARVIDTQVGTEAGEAKTPRGPKAGRTRGVDKPASQPYGGDFEDAEFEVKAPAGKGPAPAEKIGLPSVVPPGPKPAPVSAGAMATRGATAAVPAVSSGAGAAAGGAAAGAGASAGMAGLAGLAAAAGPAAIAVAAVGAVAITAAAGAKIFADTMHEQAEKLQGYSNELSNQQAQTDLRAEMADMRRAQSIGPQLAKFENDRSKVMTALSDIGTSVLSTLLSIYETFRPLIEVGVRSFEIVAASAEFTAESAAATKALATLQLEEAREHADKAAKALNKIGQILTDQNEEDDPLNDPFLAMFLGNTNGSSLNPDIPPPPGAPALLGI